MSDRFHEGVPDKYPEIVPNAVPSGGASRSCHSTDRRPRCSGRCCWGFRVELRAMVVVPVQAELRAPADRRLLALTFGVLGLVTIGFLAGTNLAWTALAGGAVVMVFGRRDTHEVLKRVDWHLMVFFAALFIVVHGFNETRLPDRLFEALQPWFWDYARFGIPVTLISTAVGVSVLLWLH